jgi:HK97 family phage prohead protease
MTMEFTRSFALEPDSIKFRSGDGRTVEAYATVFDTLADVRDADGEYQEVIDPKAFNMAIGLKRRSGGGWDIPVMFNHGMTLFHTPSEIDSVPIGVAEEIKPDKRGLFTRTRYHDTPRANAVLESIRERSITAYSFSGAFRKSDPPVPRGGFRRNSRGELPVVRRMESTLREFGPATFPVYQGAEVVGVRAEQAALLLSQLTPGEIDRLVSMIASSSRTDQLDAGIPDEGTATEEQIREEILDHSVRSPKERLMARYAEFIINTRSA